MSTRTFRQARRHNQRKKQKEYARQREQMAAAIKQTMALLCALPLHRRIATAWRIIDRSRAIRPPKWWRERMILRAFDKAARG